MKYLIYIFSFASILFSSCIENDIPYPVIKVNIESITGEGFTTKNINLTDRVVTLTLKEDTDISKVTIDEIVITEGATSSITLIDGIFDMNTPIVATLSLYQDYVWTIKAEQDIEREFTVEGQIGGAEFDVENKTAKAYVYKGADLKNVEVKKLTLGPEGITTITPSIDKLKNFSSPLIVDVKYHDVSEKWTLSVEYLDTPIEFTKRDVWTTMVWLEAAGAGKDVGFRYRAEGTQEWITVAKEDVTINGGLFSTNITRLTPSAKYEFIAYSDDDKTDVYSATTDPATPLENGELENWNKAGKAWFPYAKGGIKYWDSGNPGATLFSDRYNTTTPSDDVPKGSTGVKSAQLKSMNIIIKFAGGSLFTGDFVGLEGMDGILRFGQPFNLRPTALKVWVKYRGGKISHVGTQPPGVDIEKGVTDDVGRVYIALGTWTPEDYGETSGGGSPEMVGTDKSPIVVDTRDQSTFFDKDAPAVIAYGEFCTSENIDDWKQVTIPLDYRTTSIVPTHIVVVGASSQYADYFVGCDDSILHIDDLELVYE